MTFYIGERDIIIIQLSKTREIHYFKLALVKPNKMLIKQVSFHNLWPESVSKHDFEIIKSEFNDTIPLVK